MSVALFTFSIAVAVMLLVWAFIGLSTTVLAQYRIRFTRETRFNLRELFVFIDPATLYAANIGAMLLAGMLVWLSSGSIFFGLVVATFVALLPRIVFKWLKQKRFERIEKQLPDALLMIAGGIKAGLTLTSAVRQVGIDLPRPLGQEFSLMQHEQRLGMSLDESLESLSHRVPLASVKLMVSAMRISSETGGGLAETLERTAHTLRSQQAVELKIRSLTAQGKLQAWVVGLLPVFLLFVLNRMEPAAMSMLWSTRIGWGTLAAVALLEFFGIWLIRKIVAIDV